MNNLLVEKDLRNFIREYSNIFPLEIIPTFDMVSKLRESCDIVFESENNLIYIDDKDCRYEVVGHWCLSNKSFDFNMNTKSFFEVLRLFKKLNKFIYFDNINDNYKSAISNHNKRIS